MHTLSRLEWRWDRNSCILWAAATTSDGRSYSVGIPLAHVVATFEAHAAEHGVVAGPFVGDVDSVEGLFSGIKRLAKSAGRAVSKAVKSTQRTLARGVAAVGKVATSKIARYAVGGLAIAFPAVGAPALAALAAASAATSVYKQGDQALQLARQVGRTSAATAAAIRRGQSVQRAVKSLSNRAAHDPRARFAVAALKTVKV